MLSKEKVLELFHHAMYNCCTIDFDSNVADRQLWYYNGWVEGLAEFCGLLLKEFEQEGEEDEQS